MRLVDVSVFQGEFGPASDSTASPVEVTDEGTNLFTTSNFKGGLDV